MNRTLWLMVVTGLAVLPAVPAIAKPASPPGGRGRWVHRMVRELRTELGVRDLLVKELPLPGCVDESASFRCGPNLRSTCVARYADACQDPRPAAVDHQAFLWLEVDGEVVFRMPTGSCLGTADVVPFDKKVFLDLGDSLVFRTLHCWGHGTWSAVWALSKRGKGVGFCERESQRDHPDRTSCQCPPGKRKWLRTHLP